MPSNLLVLFNRPLVSFANNIIYIDRPNNHKTRLEVVCTIFCFLKITSFHTPILRLCCLHLSYRGKMTRKVVSNTRSIVVFRVFSRLFSFAILERKTDCRRILAVSCIKPKFTEHAQQNALCLLLSRGVVAKQRGILLRMRQENLFGAFGAISIFSVRFCGISTERSTPFWYFLERDERVWQVYHHF